MDIILIKNGRVIDPISKTDEKLDLLIENKVISDISRSIEKKADLTIDASGLIVAPGFVDMHCHLRDPGDPENETIASGTRSAAKGGFTSVACMPNTKPVLDTQAMIKYVVSKAKEEGVVNVYPVGAVTKGLKGEELTEMGSMVGEGAVAFSDDGRPVVSARMMRIAIEYASQFGVKVISHAEDLSLANGFMNEGKVSTRLGLKGIPREAEENMVSRDILLAKESGEVHITHISTKGSVELIRRAKRDGIKVTCDTCPHYFSITEEAVEGFNTYAKVNPPLRTEEDRLAIIEGLKDGTIDAIATDHAPHKEEKKNLEFGLAANGMVGFETAFSLANTFLAEKIGLVNLVAKLTLTPSQILGIDRGTLTKSGSADITIFDPNANCTVDIQSFVSKSHKSPFNGMKLKGKVLYTIVAGNIVYKNPHPPAIAG